MKQEKDLKNKVTQPAVDFSLKSNAKLSISIGQKKGKDAANENTDSDQQLDSPLKPVSNISFATSSKTTPTNWVKF